MTYLEVEARLSRAGEKVDEVHDLINDGSVISENTREVSFPKESIMAMDERVKLVLRILGREQQLSSAKLAEELHQDEGATLQEMERYAAWGVKISSTEPPMISLTDQARSLAAQLLKHGPG